MRSAMRRRGNETFRAVPRIDALRFPQPQIGGRISVRLIII
jgi:hypothetical protein